MLMNQIVRSSAGLSLLALAIATGISAGQDAPAKAPPAPANPAVKVNPAVPAQVNPAAPVQVNQAAPAQVNQVAPAGAQAAQNANPSAPAQQYRAKQILGSQVTVQGDASVGTVDDMVLDDHGNVDYLIVARADGKLVTVPWDATIFNADKRMATVQITQEKFQQVPTYTTQQYPAYATPAYRSQVYQYYGLTPGQSRRLVRRGVVVAP
jgi:hypothetical protein